MDKEKTVEIKPKKTHQQRPSVRRTNQNHGVPVLQKLFKFIHFNVSDNKENKGFLSRFKPDDWV